MTTCRALLLMREMRTDFKTFAISRKLRVASGRIFVPVVPGRKWTDQISRKLSEISIKHRAATHTFRANTVLHLTKLSRLTLNGDLLLCTVLKVVLMTTIIRNRCSTPERCTILETVDTTNLIRQRQDNEKSMQDVLRSTESQRRIDTHYVEVLRTTYSDTI